jgi:FAD/FMN-containing dehydrogenase
VSITQIFSEFPAPAVITDADRLSVYGTDPTGRFIHPPLAVLRPGSVDDVASMLRTCSDNRIAVVPQGGNTGLVGGAIPIRDEVVMTLDRVRQIEDVDKGSVTLVAGAGATLQSVQDSAHVRGLDLPIDFAARASATVGGMIATDAGGALVMRHGTMRDRVAGLEVVLADGTVVDHLHRPEKDSTGFDLTKLIPGSEGTLGIVTRARLRLIPQSRYRVVAVVAFASLEDAARALSVFRSDVLSLEAADFFLRAGLDLVREHFGLPQLFDKPHEAYLVLSCAGPHDPTDEMGRALSRCDGVAEAVVAESADQREKLWSYRELHNEAINATGIPHKLDVSVAPDRVPELVARIDAWLSVRRPDARSIFYGHLADGNVHVNVIEAEPADDAIAETILMTVAEMGGSISSEHGVGQAKVRWLHLSRSAAEIEKMRALKRALDPHGILNPGKLLPPSGPSAD